MSLGAVTATINPGSAQTGPSALTQARQLVILNVSPGGMVNTLYTPQGLAGAAAAFDTGPLAEEVALILGTPGAPPPIGVPMTQTSVGALSTVVAGAANAGAGTVATSAAPHKSITVKCSTSGTLGTAAFQFSLAGGAYSAPVVSVAGATWAYPVPGTFTTLTFAAASYVATKTCAIGVDGTVTNGAAWVGVVTQASSPIDSYEILCTVTKAGALGAASLSVSLDNGFSTVGNFLAPASGLIVVTDGRGNGTGVVLTCVGPFALADTYTGLALPPSYASSDITSAMTALQNDPNRPAVAFIHLAGLPSTAAGAFSALSTLETAIQTAFAAGLDWQGGSECPWAPTSGTLRGDVVMSGGVPILDTADTDTVIRTARVGIEALRTEINATTGGIISPVTGIKMRRPFGWALSQRYAATTPAQSLARPKDGSLNFTINRDEKTTAITLSDSQINVPQTRDGFTGSFLAITSGGFALKNLTLNALYQDAEGLRALNILSAALRVFGSSVLADRPPVNADNTIAEVAARGYDLDVDTVGKKAVGLQVGGAFTVPQVSVANSSIARSSVLGASPRQLVINVSFKGLGMISSVLIPITVAGA